MKGMLAVVASIALTVTCWGVYGPVLHLGQGSMDHSRLRPFFCVGLAYFVIGVIVPTLLLTSQGERGRWTFGGALWGLAGGTLGALGALGLVLAFTNHARPLYVMPLVFGGAPVVNAFLTILWARAYRDIGPMFLAGLILVVTGGVTVLVTGLQLRPARGPADASFAELLLALGFTGLTILCWGCYGPVLHKAQALMEQSRLRPLLCVGVAYFSVAVVVPVALLGAGAEPSGHFTASGTVWSLMAGAAGACGALGVIMAFNSGGKPVYVMPLIFSGAPVFNTFVTLSQHGLWHRAGPLFYAGLLIVVVGAAAVLVFAPRARVARSASAPARPDRSLAGAAAGSDDTTST